MNLWWLIVSGVGLIVLAASIVAARKPVIGSTEARLFHAVNGLPDWLYVLLWVPMQLGNLVVGTGAGLAVALVARNLVMAFGVIMAMALKLVTERIVRREMADYLAIRQRPGTSQTGAILRGSDVPSSGPSFPSGHVILVAAVGSVVAPELPAAWWWLPIVLTVARHGRAGVRRRPQPARRHGRAGRRAAARWGAGDVRQLTAARSRGSRSAPPRADVDSGWPDRCASISDGDQLGVAVVQGVRPVHLHRFDVGQAGEDVDAVDVARAGHGRRRSRASA